MAITLRSTAPLVSSVSVVVTSYSVGRAGLHSAALASAMGGSATVTLLRAASASPRASERPTSLPAASCTSSSSEKGPLLGEATATLGETSASALMVAASMPPLTREGRYTPPGRARCIAGTTARRTCR